MILTVPKFVNTDFWIVFVGLVIFCGREIFRSGRDIFLLKNFYIGCFLMNLTEDFCIKHAVLCCTMSSVNYFLSMEILCLDSLN